MSVYSIVHDGLRRGDPVPALVAMSLTQDERASLMASVAQLKPADIAKCIPVLTSGVEEAALCAAAAHNNLAMVNLLRAHVNTRGQAAVAHAVSVEMLYALRPGIADPAVVLDERRQAEIQLSEVDDLLDQWLSAPAEPATGSTGQVVGLEATLRLVLERLAQAESRIEKMEGEIAELRAAS